MVHISCPVLHRRFKKSPDPVQVKGSIDEGGCPLFCLKTVMEAEKMGKMEDSHAKKG